MPVTSIHSDSVLFVTLDSCRYDTFSEADAPFMKAVAPLQRAIAPGYFTYASHSAMFVGFTPQVSHSKIPFLNPKYAKIFKLVGAGHPGSGEEAFLLRGANIVDGFAAAGYTTIGTGAVGWFDPATPPGHHLTSFFQYFHFEQYGIAKQISWIDSVLSVHADHPVFLFINIGETHAPYWHQGASWSSADNACQPFQTIDRRSDCAFRQRRCLEYVDRNLAPLLDRFSHATVLICADHGDAWGEGSVWEHGIPHPMVYDVPFLFRLRGQAIFHPPPQKIITKQSMGHVQLGV